MRDLPESLIVERQILNSIFIDSSQVDDLVLSISVDMFADMNNKAVYESILKLYSEGNPIDLSTVHDAINRDGKSVKLDYLFQISEEDCTPSHSGHYAEILKSKYLARKAILLCRNTALECYDTAEPKEQIEKLENQLINLISNTQKGKFESIKSLVDEYLEIIKRRQSNESKESYLTGFDYLDAHAQITPGRLYIIAAKPKHGKTTFGMQLSHNLCAQNNIGVGFIPLEMTKYNQIDKLTCIMAGLDSWKLQNGFLSKAEISKLKEKLTEFSKLPFFINDTPGQSIHDIKANIRLLKRKHDIKAVFIDYVQIMRTPYAETRQQSIAQLSTELVTLARQLNIAIIAMSQVNADYRTREAEDLENDASVVIKLWRPEQEKNNSKPGTQGNTKEFYDININGVKSTVSSKNLTFMNLALNRFGATGQCALYFDDKRGQFYDYGKEPQ